jgi:ABC-type bacteriocin/lantibiotic exporter with double-glycine peptidase domain
VSAVLDIFLLLGYTGLMLAYHVPLACAVIVLSLMRVGLLVQLRARNEQLMTTELAASGQERATLVEALSSLETVKASFSQDRVLGLWFPRFVRRLNVSMERQRLVIASSQAMTVLQGIATAAVFWIGGKEVFSEHITLGVFTAFLALQGLFLTPLESMLGAITEFQFLLSHLQRMDDVLETPSEPNGHFDPGKLRGEIVLENVRFRYSPGSPYIIRDVSLRIAPGEKVALVGSTGAGKSTLARLLMGMHLPTEGRIYFDGHDLRVLNLDSLRRQLGVVLQDSFLFDDTVRANLALRDPEIPLKQLQGAAKLACINHVIDRLPDGYKTMLGENGRSLSGGERQRLCLARALALDPAILLLDEATSSLDLETEAEVHANLARFGCTRIVIAHRLETVKDAHRILVLKDGALVQEGPYEELAAVPGPLRDVAQAMEASRA